MAYCRCIRHPPRSKKYRFYVNPIGYPDALVCGTKNCSEPAVIWLDQKEMKQYKKGERIFLSSAIRAKFRADNHGINKYE